MDCSKRARNPRWISPTRSSLESQRRTPARITAALLIVALGLPLSFAAEPPAPAAAPATPVKEPPVPTKGTARIQGRIFRSDGKTAVEGAVVRACYLQNSASLPSERTGAKGDFSIAGLPSGYADIAIETPDGVFIANQVLQFLPGKGETVDFVLTRYTERPAEWWSGQEKRQVPCAGGESAGTADIRTGSTAKGFFKTGTGIAVLAGAGVALILLAASGGGSNETAASPSAP